MKADIPELRRQIAALSIDEEVRAALLKEVKGCEKELVRREFKINRTLTDKGIVVNLLKASVEELEARKAELSVQNQQIEENLRHLEMSYHELEQFSYIASHDLKSPLRNIASYAQLLSRRYKGQLDAEADEFIGFIVKGAKHMDEIIRDLLEYSKSAKENDFIKTDLNNTLEVVKFNLQQEILENNARVEVANLPQLSINKSAVSQLFQNLIGNAIKFKGERAPVILVSCELQENQWLFKVADNGVGMDESFQEKAFLPFQRINNLERPGTGMGLAICKKVVKMHKGDIWYESKIGQGTTFNFTITE
ncbi:MAG: light-regulated signal transduction histidine kinase (bacteriophytochrome) [Paraglaciecola sp.]|jgi:light-regulated signal transduction histidine kinase (bacteriophytochrome)